MALSASRRPSCRVLDMNDTGHSWKKGPLVKLTTEDCSEQKGASGRELAAGGLDHRGPQGTRGIVKMSGSRSIALRELKRGANHDDGDDGERPGVLRGA